MSKRYRIELTEAELGRLRDLVDSSGVLAWEPSRILGAPDLFLGRSVREVPQFFNRRYTVIYDGYGYQNCEIEVTPEKAAEIREELKTSLRERGFPVWGRDWQYVGGIPNMLSVEATGYSVSSNGTVHFYRDGGKDPFCSILNAKAVYVEDDPGIRTEGMPWRPWAGKVAEILHK